MLAERGRNAVLCSVVLGLVSACMLVAWRDPSGSATVLLTKCGKEGCVHLDEAAFHKEEKRQAQLPAARKRRAQDAVRFGMLGSVGNNDDENDEGVLFVVGKHVHAREHPEYWIDEHHDLNGKKLDGDNKFAPSWWSKGRAKQTRPYVVWGSRYHGDSGEAVHADDYKLTKHGVNVEGREADLKGLPFPFLDKTEYNFQHATGRVLPTDAAENEEQERASSSKLRKAGVRVDGLPLEETPRTKAAKSINKFDGLGDKVVAAGPCVYNKVDVAGGMQKQNPYFHDNNDAATSEEESEQTLLSAGVNVRGRMHTEAIDAAMTAPGCQ